MNLSRADFRGGETTLPRVSVDSPAILRRSNGYQGEGGRLVPENVCSRLNGAEGALGETVPDQCPTAFTNQAGTSVLARDTDEGLRVFSSGSWGTSEGTVDVLAESIPAKCGDLVVFPTGGASARMMAFEPGSASTNLRPLSLKSPADYNATERPSVTPSASPAVRLFDCDDGDVWAAPGAGCSVDNTATGKAVFTITSATPADTLILTKALPGGGISLSGMAYLCLDIRLQDDTQPYDTLGLFGNDPQMAPSGYLVALYSDTACTALLGSYYLPRIGPETQANRLLLSISGLSGTVQGVGIRTATFFVAPTSSTLTLYSGAFASDWSMAGNWLLPPVKWQKSPVYSLITAPTTDGEAIELPAGSNLLTHGGFEAATDWTFGNGASRKSDLTRSGSYCLELDNHDGGPETAAHAATTVSAGQTLEIEAWYRSTSGGLWFIELTPNGGAPVVTFPTGGYYTEDASLSYRRKAERYTVPAGVTTIALKLSSYGSAAQEDFRVDDVSIRQVSSASPGTCYLLSRFTEDGSTRVPGNSAVRWCYAFAGRDRLGADDWALMVSNPSDPDSQDGSEVYADPWRTYALSVTLPGGATTVTTEYGSYVTHLLFYRQIKDGATGVWSSWQYVGKAAIGATVAWTDSGSDEDATLDTRDIPYEREITNDYASSARFVMYSEGRVYAACLDWDNGSSRWRRPTAIEVSSYGKSWAFPTTVTSDSLITDGSELDGYAIGGSEIRGLVARGSEKYVFLDTEFFLLRGSDPLTGYGFERIDTVPCVSGRTIADCRSALIWHSGSDFYAYEGGLSRAISRWQIDSSLIDWTKAHNAVYWDGRYVFSCTYDTVPSLLIFDIETGGWRIRRSAALGFAGLCTDGLGTLYGVTLAGDLVDPFGSSGADYGAASTLREVWTRYILLAEPTADRQVSALWIEAETTVGAGVSLGVELYGQGNTVNSVTGLSVTVLPTSTRYRLPVDIIGNAVAVRLSCASTTPPVIHSITLEADDEVLRS